MLKVSDVSMPKTFCLRPWSIYLWFLVVFIYVVLSTNLLFYSTWFFIKFIDINKKYIFKGYKQLNDHQEIGQVQWQNAQASTENCSVRISNWSIRQYQISGDWNIVTNQISCIYIKYIKKLNELSLFNNRAVNAVVGMSKWKYFFAYFIKSSSTTRAFTKHTLYALVISCSSIVYICNLYIYIFFFFLIL